MFLNFFDHWSDFGKISESGILPRQCHTHKCLITMIFHPLLHSYSGFVSDDFLLVTIGPSWAKIWSKIWPNFFVLPPQNGIWQNALDPQVSLV